MPMLPPDGWRRDVELDSPISDLIEVGLERLSYEMLWQGAPEPQ